METSKIYDAVTLKGSYFSYPETINHTSHLWQVEIKRIKNLHVYRFCEIFSGIQKNSSEYPYIFGHLHIAIQNNDKAYFHQIIVKSVDLNLC